MGKIIFPATLHWSDDNQPFATHFNDCYFSVQDGLAETRHVFLEGNQLPQRWQNLRDDLFVIGETGFGTGLNFIAAWQLWQNSAPKNSQLYFISAELHPLCKADLARAAALWPELKFFYDQLLEQYPTLTAGFHILHFNSPCSSNVTLLLMLGDASETFCELLDTDHPDFYSCIQNKMDCWFLDGFAPAKNPQLWTDALINTLALLSRPGTTLATFSAAGHMRRSLEAAGFTVQKQKGFASKREMVSALFQPDENNRTAHQQSSMLGKPAFVSSPYAAPWYLVKNKPLDQRKDVSIIGAGIAGCTLANALAQKGMHVTVIDEMDKPAAGASGNLQAVLYSKLSATDDEFAEFNLASYLYALRFYKNLLRDTPTLAIHLCGVLQLSVSEKEQEVQDALSDFFSHYPDIATAVDQKQASELAGVPVETGGLFFAQAGWIHPASICEQLLKHPNITTRFNQRISSIHHENNAWQLLQDAQTVNSSNHVVIASGHQCRQFEQSKHLSLKLIRGQVSHATPTTVSRQLKTVVSGEGYIAPAENNTQSFGATYTPKMMALTLSDTDHKTNLENLALSSRSLSEEWNINKNIVGGRAHLRTATSDYFPVCGPLPKQEDFLNTYAPLRKNANANIPEAGAYYPNLYVFAGLGSRGMSYAPLCAAVLSNVIAGHPSALPRNITQQLNPARFVIRDLIKNRV